MRNSKDIIFSGVFLVVNDVQININDFQRNKPEGEYKYTANDVKAYVHTCKYQDNYLKLIFQDGSGTPRNPNVFNTETEQISPNPRQSNEVETKCTYV